MRKLKEWIELVGLCLGIGLLGVAGVALLTGIMFALTSPVILIVYLILQHI